MHYTVLSVCTTIYDQNCEQRGEKEKQTIKIRDVYFPIFLLSFNPIHTGVLF